MTNRFDLEQQILACWGITDDLQQILDAWSELSEDQQINILLGLKDLYELKFRKCFSIFENCVHEQVI